MREGNASSVPIVGLVFLACLVAPGIASTCEVDTNIFRGQGNGPLDAHASCQKYCEAKEGIFRSGENWTDYKQPCLQYRCDIGKVLISKVKCEDASACPDGLPPYYIPGECCLQCDLDKPDAAPSLVLSEWSEWTACSRPCGRGKRTRSRSCTPNPAHKTGHRSSRRPNSVQCQGHLYELDYCAESTCTVHAQ